MTDAILAHVRFSDHVARCGECALPCGDLTMLCAHGRELLGAWQEAEHLNTRHAEELDAACAQEGGMAWRDDATGAA